MPRTDHMRARDSTLAEGCIHVRALVSGREEFTIEIEHGNLPILDSNLQRASRCDLRSGGHFYKARHSVTLPRRDCGVCSLSAARSARPWPGDESWTLVHPRPLFLRDTGS